MEPLAPAKRLTLIVAALTLSAAAGMFVYSRWSELSLGRDDLPALQLSVKLLDAEGNTLDAEHSLIAGGPSAPAGSDHCPELKGGDLRFPSTALPDEERPVDCPRIATWYVKKHPIAATLYFNNGKRFLQWWDTQPDVKTIIGNRFTQGLFFGLLKSAKIKAEQINLQGLQGEFLQYLLRDAIAANAELHYDMMHGNRGWVLSYQWSDSSYTKQAVPIMARVLAGNAYRLTRLPEPVLEMRIGTQRLFLTQYRHRIYLAQSLEALLNVIDSVKPRRIVADAPLSLVLRTEAFIGKLVPVWTGSETSEARLDFDLQDGKFGSLALPSGPWSLSLHENIFEGVLAAIPHDAFAAVAASLQLPPTMTIEDWRHIASGGRSPTNYNAPGGMALVWDFDDDDPHGAIGVILANPESPEASPAYSQYLKDPELGVECAGGSVYLAATSHNLLTRMKEACEKQSMSPLDWQRNVEKQRYLSSQLVSFINPGTGLRQLFLAGGAGNGDDINEFAPQWKQEYEQAKAAMREDGDKLFNRLPIFSYAGRLTRGGAINLQGHLVEREIKQ
ncbi:MAG: hypothetical protein ACU836_01070 [Gammaproteobacteria bacterium]